MTDETVVGSATHVEGDPSSAAASGDEADAGNDAKAGRSRIKFPYTDVDDAVSVARTIKEKHGSGPMPLDQLAAALGGASIKSGAFRTKLATAGTFGAIRSSRGHVQLTELGHRLSDEQTRASALAEAFLNVPLYRRIYDDYQGKNLPGDPGLETEIRRLGVVANQADRARQTFQRSAEKAGFFWAGRTRLVAPLAPQLQAGEPVPPQEAPPAPPPVTDRTENVVSNALLAALLKKMLPDEDQEFPAKDRRRFFRALAVNLDVVYGEPRDGEIDPDKLAEIFRDKPLP